MKKILFTGIAVLALLLATNGLMAQQKSPSADKAKKEVVILKEEVDENGNVTVKKIVREAAPGEVIIDENGNKVIKVEVETDVEGMQNVFIIKDGKAEDVEFNANPHGETLEWIDVKVETDENGEPVKKVIIKTRDGAIMEQGALHFGDDLHFDHDMDIEVEVDENGNEQKHYAIKMKGPDGEVFEWEGDGEIPAEVKEKLEKHKVQLMEGHSFAKLHKMHENKAFLGVVSGDKVEVIEETDGVETTVKRIEEENGALVKEVVEGSAAEEAGLKAGDVITEIAGESISNFSDLVEALGGKEVGDAVAITYLRDGQTANTTATLKARKANFNFTFDNDEHRIHKVEKIIIISRSDSEELEEEEEHAEAPLEVEETAFPDFDPNATKLELEAFDAFPNPTDGILTLQFKGEAAPVTVRVTDLNGQQIYREFIRDFDGNFNKQVDLSDAPRGTYLLSINQNDQIYTQKILIQ